MKAMKLSNSDISIISVDNSLEAIQKVIGEKIETIGLSDDGVMIVTSCGSESKRRKVK